MLTFATGASDVTVTTWSTGGSQVLPKPSGVVDDDLMWMLVYCQQGASTVTAPAGWTERYHVTAASSRGFYLFTKPVPSAAAETPTTYTVTLSSSVVRGIGMIGRCPASANFTFDAAPASDVYVTGGGAATVAATGVTAGTAAAVQIACYFANGTGSVTHTWAATGFTVVKHANVVPSASTSSVSILVKQLTATGATGTVTGTATASDSTTIPASSGGFTVTFAPAPVVAGAAMASGSVLVAAGTVTGGPAAALTSASVLTAAGTRSTPVAAVMTSGSVMTAMFQTRVARWIATRPMYAAHRDGFYGVHGEMTMQGYDAAAAWNPDLAFEVSVWRSSDSVWVCSHDQTTGRVCGTNLDIPTSTWASLSALTTTVGGNPLIRLSDLLTKYGASKVMLIDNKADTNSTAFLDFLDTYSGNQNYIVKSFCSSRTTANAALLRGYQTWGYFYDADIANLATYSPSWSLLGMDYTGTQGNWDTIKATGKYVIAHTIATLANKATADTKSGGTADGYMVSDVATVVTQQALTAALVSGSVLTAAGARSTPVAAVMASGSVLTADSARTTTGAAALTSGSILTAAATKTTSGAAVLTSGSVLTAAGDRTTSAAAVLTSGSVLVAAAALGAVAAAALTSGSVLSAASGSVPGAAVLTSSSVLTAAGTRSTLAAAVLASASILTAAATRTTTGAAVLVSASVLTAAGARTTSGAAVLVSASVLTAAGARTTSGAAVLVSASVLTVDGQRTTFAAVVLLSGSVLTAGGVTPIAAAAVLVSASTLTAVAAVAPPGRDVTVTVTPLFDHWAAASLSDRWSVTPLPDHWSVAP